MITLRRSDDRGHADHGWLDSHHTFSFAGYHDPDHMGFRSLLVINEDRVQPGQGFGTHPHRDMEILSVVLEGSLQHKDSMGNGSVIRPGDIQRMSAGTGVLHSEFNPSRAERVHFLQIWLLPEARNMEPGYEQKAFPPSQRLNALRLVASRDGRDGSLIVHQDAEIYVSTLEPSRTVEHRLGPGRGAWVQVTRGGLRLNGERLQVGDGASISGEEQLTITADEQAEFLLFDLA